MFGWGMPSYRMLESGALESTNLHNHRSLFIFFFEGWQNNLKNYLQFFVVTNYLLIFVENNNKKRHENFKSLQNPLGNYTSR